MTYEQALEKAAADYIRGTLIGCGWNVTAAAMSAGLNRTYFYELMRRYGIKRPQVYECRPMPAVWPRMCEVACSEGAL
jgi:DNA-binding NtrC family response regulator